MTDIAIRVQNLSKCYQIYDSPRDRLKQFVMPMLHRVASPIMRWFPTPHFPTYCKEFWALKDVSFEIRKGETVGIIGRNGSGKSTLLQMICGTLNPTSGSIQTNGRIAALLELGSGFNPEFTGRENVYMNAAVLGLNNEETDARFEDIVAFADIGDFVEQPVKTYSSGMVVRLSFAVAINVDPEILIVDEALSVGDELFQRKCFSRIESIRANGATILFVSHSGGTIVELCDRAVLMDSGELLVSGMPKSVVGKYQKLLYAPEVKREVIRNEIKATPVSADLAPERKRRETTALQPIDNPGTDVSSEEFFDLHLKPQSTIVYESHSTYIESPEILTLSGERVNCLKRGNSYRYNFKIRFDKDARYVRFGMLIKTVSGVAVGGATSAKNIVEGIPYISAGTTICAEYIFVCHLNEGLYFVNAGVSGDIGEGFSPLHRLVDASCFRVNPQVSGFATGIVDFNCYPEWSFCEQYTC